jgi:hypothetical protein
MFVVNVDQADFLFQSGIYSEIMIDQRLSHTHRDYGLKRFRHDTIKLDTARIDEIETLCINTLAFFQDQTEGYLWLPDFCIIHFVMLQSKDHIDRKNEVICGKCYALDLGLLPSVAEFDKNVNQVLIKKPQTQDWILLVQKTISPEIKVEQTNWIRVKGMILLGLALIVGIYFAHQNGFFSKKTDGREIENTIIPAVKETVEKPWKEPDLGITSVTKYKQYYSEIYNSNYDDKFKTNAKLLNMYLEKTDNQSKINMLYNYFCSNDTKIEVITENDIKDKKISASISASHETLITNSSEKLQKLKDSIIDAKCPEKKQ